VLVSLIIATIGAVYIDIYLSMLYQYVQMMTPRVRSPFGWWHHHLRLCTSCYGWAIWKQSAHNPDTLISQ